MNFLRLHDPLLSVLYEDSDIIAIDKPYGFNAHTNDSKIEHSTFVEDGLIEIYEKNRGHKLHIIHRLDQTTTGVMIFGKSVESAKKYAEFFFNRLVKKTYWFVTDKASLAESHHIDKTILHKGRELEASTDFQFVKKSNHFYLWKAYPHTGRNHQIRIHAEVAGLPLLGDEKYNGKQYPFLCLHNQLMDFPNNVKIASKLPSYFENLDLLNDIFLAKLFFEYDRRQRLFGSNSAHSYRLVHNLNRSYDPGYTLDQFGDNCILNWSKDLLTKQDIEKIKYFSDTIKKPILLIYNNKEQLISAGENQAINEAGLKLNQRLQSYWISKNSENKSVLNLFSNTGIMALASAEDKASSVTLVEMQKSFLNRSKILFEENHLLSESTKFLCRDSLTYLEQCLQKKTSYDLIICEAPSFFRREKGLFKIEKDLENLLELCLKSLNQNGQLLFSTQYEDFYINDLKEAFEKVQKKLKLKDLEINCILPSMDFERPQEKANLKSFLVQKNQ